MRSCLTDCPSDYEIMFHRLSLGLWDYDPQIVPRIVRSCPTGCPSIMRSTMFLDDFDFQVFFSIFGTRFLLSPCFLEIDFSDFMAFVCAYLMCKVFDTFANSDENGMTRLESRYVHNTS